jgi:hypothetical protein
MTSMVLAARTGVSVGTSAYDTLDARMVQAPSNVLVAYEQATYFIALAARRALREDETAAATALQSALSAVAAESDAVSAKVNWFCRTIGVACPRGGSVRVLREAAEAIELSGLNVDDRTQIVNILDSNRRALQLKQAVPLIVTAGVGLAFGTWWYHKRT